jgi:hypothetical protein
MTGASKKSAATGAANPAGISAPPKEKGATGAPKTLFRQLWESYTPFRAKSQHFFFIFVPTILLARVAPIPGPSANP